MSKHLWDSVLVFINLYTNINISELYIDLLTNFKLIAFLSFLNMTICLILEVCEFPNFWRILTRAINWFDLQALFIILGICESLD